MIDEPIYRLPTIDEVLGGEMQGGVPRPSVSTDRVLPGTVQAPVTLRMGRWQAIKALLRIIFMGK